MTKDKSKIKLEPALKEQLKEIPTTSGIYMMHDKRGEIIYIGKAKNLKDRVRTYLNVKSWDARPKLYFMMPKVKEIKTFITNSEKEALILEANLINKHQPKYNVTLKDDKKFPWLMITMDEEYPRVVPIRDVKRFKSKYPKTKNKFFGPYSDAGAMWETYKIIKEGFGLRLRRKPLFKDRPCMNYHIGLCSGPCQELISYDDYHKIVKQIEGFLLGKYKDVLKNLKKEMKKYSDELNYEKAAGIRDIIKKIEKVLEKQIVVSDDVDLNQDVFACDFNDKSMVLNVALIREGKVISFETLVVGLPVKTLNSVEDSKEQLAILEETFTDAIKQYYTRAQDKNIPDIILSQFELNETSMVEEWLSGRKEKKVKILNPKKGNKLELVKMVEQNAKLSLQRMQALDEGAIENELEEKRQVTLKGLKKSLDLKNIPSHMECFDISHLGGTGTVASMVTFIDGVPDKSKYRKFKIKELPLNKIDDFESMREVVFRRYKNLKEMPDLIIIDGGKGQLSSAKESLDRIFENLPAESSESYPDLISLAKREEEVFKPGAKTSIILDKDSEELFMLQRIRNEAHRFAVKFQRETRAKNTFTSELEKIQGLGPAKIKKLNNYFGSLKNIKESDLQKFAEVLGQKEDVAKPVWEKIKEI